MMPLTGQEASRKLFLKSTFIQSVTPDNEEPFNSRVTTQGRDKEGCVIFREYYKTWKITCM